MNIRKESLLLFIVLIAALSACVTTVGPKAVDDAYLHDFVFSVELRHDQSTYMWLRNDTVGIYCLPNPDIYTMARTIAQSQNPEVVLHYKSLNALEFPGCHNPENTSKDQGSVVYVVLEIHKAEDLPR